HELPCPVDEQRTTRVAIEQEALEGFRDCAEIIFGERPTRCTNGHSSLPDRSCSLSLAASLFPLGRALCARTQLRSACMRRNNRSARRRSKGRRSQRTYSV